MKKIVIVFCVLLGCVVLAQKTIGSWMIHKQAGATFASAASVDNKSGISFFCNQAGANFLISDSTPLPQNSELYATISMSFDGKKFLEQHEYRVVKPGGFVSSSIWTNGFFMPEGKTIYNLIKKKSAIYFAYQPLEGMGYTVYRYNLKLTDSITGDIPCLK
jgi:hypothetical protein